MIVSKDIDITVVGEIRFFTHCLSMIFLQCKNIELRFAIYKLLFGILYLSLCLIYINPIWLPAVMMKNEF